jgi:uncharacterized protein YidB (DUF937 family)
MAYKHYTSCYIYPDGGKPYNESDQVAFAATQILIALAITGIGALIGLLAGPIGALIGTLGGSIVGFTNLLNQAADEWLNHRLICLDKDNPKCAVGIVSFDPTRSDLGTFDNDQYFDVVLMPHPAELMIGLDEKIFDPDITSQIDNALVPANRYDANGKVVDSFAKHIADHPDNKIWSDGFQGQRLLSARLDINDDLGYASPKTHERNMLHCEAEGDFWVRIKKFAPALAALIDAALAAAAVGAVAGSSIGSAAGCAIGSFFFGPIGCAIGAALGGLLGGAAGAAAGGAATYFGVIAPILQEIFDAGPGDVEDANVGDKALGPIAMNDIVAVMGEHVYDGYHDCWNEFHPLMAVVKIDKSGGVGPGYYLQWQPSLPGKPPPPPPGEAITLTKDDLKQGLNSDNFRQRCEHLKDTWCRMLSDAFSEKTRQKQQALDERWTIHPMVDGCRRRDDGGEPPPIH